MLVSLASGRGSRIQGDVRAHVHCYAAQSKVGGNMASEQVSALQRHLEYCPEIIAVNEDAIIQMQCGDLRVRDNEVDMTAIWIAKPKGAERHSAQKLGRFWVAAARRI